MTDQIISDVVIKAISDVLGVEGTEIKPDTDFHLDLNSTPDEIKDIKTIIETQLDITLPDISLEATPTVADLQALVDDSSL